MIFIGYQLSTTGLKQFTKLCFYCYSKASTVAFYFIFLLISWSLFVCGHFQIAFCTKLFVLKRLNHFVTCLVSKCLELLLQVTEHSFNKLWRSEKEFWPIIIVKFLWEYNILLEIPFEWHHDLTQECVMVTSMSKSNKVPRSPNNFHQMR